VNRKRLTGAPWPDVRRARPSVSIRYADQLEQITTKFFGRSVYGSYVIEGAMLTVKTPRGKKATQLGNSNSHFVAEWLFV